MQVSQFDEEINEKDEEFIDAMDYTEMELQSSINSNTKCKKKSWAVTFTSEVLQTLADEETTFCLTTLSKATDAETMPARCEIDGSEQKYDAEHMEITGKIKKVVNKI